MNLMININQNLHSVKGSAEGQQKIKAAVIQAIDDVQALMEQNKKLLEKGLAAKPIQTIVTDEYGKDLVSIREAQSLEDIRKEYQKWQEKKPYEERERNLLEAINEVGNSQKDQWEFNTQLKRIINKSVFIKEADLTPGIAEILNFFGDSRGMFSSIDFKKKISENCIKRLIDLPNPKTGKPPKTYEQLFENINALNNIFKPSKDLPKKEYLKKEEERKYYLECARMYIKISHPNLIPKEYREFFSDRDGLNQLIANNRNKKTLFLNEKNFKDFFKAIYSETDFNGKPLKTLEFCLKMVKPENKKEIEGFLLKQGWRGQKDMMEKLNSWGKESDPIPKKSIKDISR